jgi:hypothetical protein
MEMVWQQTVGKQTHGEAGRGLAHKLDKPDVVAFVAEDLAAGIAAVEDVVTVAAKSGSGRAWHAANPGEWIGQQQERVKTIWNGPVSPRLHTRGAGVFARQEGAVVLSCATRNWQRKQT